MFFDREVLVTQIFPEITRFCRDRGVEFTGIDLQTGVTAEQTGRKWTDGERDGWHIPSNGQGDALLEKKIEITVTLHPEYGWINSIRDRYNGSRGPLRRPCLISPWIANGNIILVTLTSYSNNTLLL